MQTSSYNRTLTIEDDEMAKYSQKLITLSIPATIDSVLNTTILQNSIEALDYLPSNSIDLIFADPPYNLTKTFNTETFNAMPIKNYTAWLDLWISKLPRLLKPTASIYVCGDWRSSMSLHRVLSRYFHIQNRITWEREKGRGAKSNWKNASEDIWFCTVSNNYTFNVDDVKLKKRVIASYRDGGVPKDWQETPQGNFRLTFPSNVWTDITVPFWSMPENTEHPTQKPEKLLAKIILASSNKGDTVFDPFLGSGATSVVAKKLERNYIGIEIDPMYCCLTEKRLELADTNQNIQGYANGVFWERNSQIK